MTKILLVDDQPTLLLLMSEFLRSEGYDVTTHTDGLTALQQMLDVRPDLVVTDFSMPGMDGGALLTAMRENAYLNETPVLVLSGRPEYEIAAACEGRATFLRKPANPDEVLAAVRRLLAAPAPQLRYRASPDALGNATGHMTGLAHGYAAYVA